MAYNNGFPVGYQPQMMYPQMQSPSYQAPIQPQAMPNQGTQNPNMIWVQGEAGAKAFTVAPNVTIPLWDSENQVIYIKTTDNTGIPSMKILDYTVRQQGEARKNDLTEKPDIDLSGFVTIEEFDKRLNEFSKRLDSLSNRPKQHEYKRSNKERNDG